MEEARMSLQEFTETVNQWAGQRIPFLCLLDFELQKPKLFKLNEINPESIRYNFNGVSNCKGEKAGPSKNIVLESHPIEVDQYAQKFKLVKHHLDYGDSYLTNLTVKTEVKTESNLDEIFSRSHAKYKLKFKDEFLFFSPETFVKIANGKIFAYPMKGTIDANVLNAREVLLADKKELAEHVTIVDLIRNDLSVVAEKVTVTNFRYVEEIKTNNKNLLQVSSEIVGQLPQNYPSKLGTILLSLLPAGSISGAPKAKTVEVIHKAESELRGYYTGIAGIFDGKDFDSGVMIRFLECNSNKLFYRSGGGITTQSIMENEYQEVIHKVYVPVS